MEIFAANLAYFFIYDFFELCRLIIPKCGGTFYFLAEPIVSWPFWFYRCWDLYEFKFFSKNFWRAARARNYELSKNEHLFRVLQNVAATKKKVFAEMWGMAKKNIWTDRNFCKILLATRIWYYVKKEGPRWCPHARILQYFMFMLLYVHQSFF